MQNKPFSVKILIDLHCRFMDAVIYFNLINKQLLCFALGALTLTRPALDFKENKNKLTCFSTNSLIVITDTNKVNTGLSSDSIYYIIAGSFLIPSNADRKVATLKEAGFQKAYRYNFKESEYYSVVVDSFEKSNENLDVLHKLRQKKIEYFIKRQLVIRE